ncbi:MAG: HTTM domain-containing protein, partial [Crocinitomicaceae bacterium]
MKILKYLNQPSQPQGLGLFRIFFGLIILWDLKRFNEIKIVESFYAHDRIFHYEFLNLPLPEIGTLKLLMGVLFICAILITLGVMYRWAMAVFALSFSYFFFLDPVLYNNHLYLLCLISFIMIFLPADGAFSLNKKRKRSSVPQWSYRLLQFHIVLVYFFGGIVK